MEKINEDEKKINFIKCPLPKIIYSALNSQIKFPKKSLKTHNNNNTSYSRKMNNRSPGLPSLKANTKILSSPSKTNYINIIKNNNLTVNNNSKNSIKNNKKLNTIHINKEIKKENLKEILNDYGLNKYYDKIVELGINDDNINDLGLMNKNSFNEFISNIDIFPGHITKMEQLYNYLKENNSYNKQLHNNSNSIVITNNNDNNANSDVNYVTISFRRNNNSLVNKIIHSQSHNKYRFINSAIKPKNINTNNNNNIMGGKSKNNIHKTNHSQNKSLNINQKKIDNNIKNFFDIQNPINDENSRNSLIKKIFKDLSNYYKNMNNIVNNLNNNQNLSLYNKNLNNINNIGLPKDNNINKEKKINDFSNTFNENHLSRLNIKEINQLDLPSISSNINNNKTKINTKYSKSIVNSTNSNNSYINQTSQIEPKNKHRKEVLNKNTNKNNHYNKDKLEKYKTIDNSQIPYNSKSEFIKNNKKEILKNNNALLEKTDYENPKNGIKLPNVMNRNDFQNSLPKSKIKQKFAEEKSQLIVNKNKILEKEEIRKNKNYTNIIIKKEKTNLTKKNKNENLNNKENNNDLNQKDNINKKNNENTVIINNWNDNESFEEIKSIRLRKKYDYNIKNNEIYKQINKNENINNQKNINEKAIDSDKDNNKKKQIIKNKEINQNKNIDNNIISNNNININISQKIEIIPHKFKKDDNLQKYDKRHNLEDIIYENLRLNRSFSENKSQDIYQFDLEFICRCLSLCLTILIETSKDSPHLTELNLESLSASHIKYFFFNEDFNENINILFDLFDNEVNKDINANQLSPLDKLELILSENEDFNYNFNCLKHIKKESDKLLIKKEEEKEKNEDKIWREGFFGRPKIGDIEKDIKFIDEFFSKNSIKKRAINYQHISEKTKNVLCKELSNINEIDSELNGTNNSNINNTMFNISNNNISDSMRGKKIVKETNISNITDNDEMKEIKEVNNNDDNNTFNNEINEFGIISENNNEIINRKEIKKNNSNNSITLGVDDMNIEHNTINKKDELKQFEKRLNEDNKIIPSPINNKEKRKINEQSKRNYNMKLLKHDKNINIKESTDTIIVKINNNKDDINDNKEENNKLKNDEVNNKNKSIIKENTSKNNDLKEKDKDDIYESDYVIDVNSIDEYIYYLIRISEIFDEDFNYYIMKISERRYIPPPEPQTIFEFMADIIILTKMEKEVIILSLIYIERLIFNTGILLNSRNWRRMLLTSMIIASKIWDDNSFENTHFSQVFANIEVGEINTMERIFLDLINYKVFVKQSEYFQYLLMIKIIASKYNYNGKQIIPVSIVKTIKYQEFRETMQNRMRRKVTLNNSAQF